MGCKVTKPEPAGEAAKSEATDAAQPAEAAPAPTENGTGAGADHNTVGADAVMEEGAVEGVAIQEVVEEVVVERAAAEPVPAVEVADDQDVDMAAPEEAVPEGVLEADEAVEVHEMALDVLDQGDAEVLPDAEVPLPGTPSGGGGGNDEVQSEAESEQDAFVGQV